MIGLTQDINRLMLHAKFEEICELPSNRVLIDALINEVVTADPEFFSANDGFCYLDEPDCEYSEFERMVQFLRELYMEGLDDDSSAAFRNVLNRYGLPTLSIEDRRGDAIASVLDVLLASIDVSVTIQPKNAEDARAYVEQAKARKMQWAEVEAKLRLAMAN